MRCTANKKETQKRPRFVKRELGVSSTHSFVAIVVIYMYHKYTYLLFQIHMCKLCSVKSLRLPLGVAIMMHLSQQLSGINCVCISFFSVVFHSL